MRAVVAEPDEKASAKRACSRAATAFSKLSLQYVRRKNSQDIGVWRTCSGLSF